MGNRIVGMVTLVCFIAHLGGCSSARFVPIEDYKMEPSKNQPDIMGVMTSDGTFYEFDLRAQSVRIENGEFAGVLTDGRMVALPIKDIKTVKIVRFDAEKTFMIAGVVGLIIAVTLITIANRGFIRFM